MKCIYRVFKEEPLFLAEDTPNYPSRRILLPMNSLLKRLFQISKKAVEDLLESSMDRPVESLDIVELESQDRMKDQYIPASLHILLNQESKSLEKSAYSIRVEESLEKDGLFKIMDQSFKRGEFRLGPIEEGMPLEAEYSMPYSLLIVLEEESYLPSQLHLFIRGGQDEILLRIPVLSLWMYSPTMLLDEGLYLLLPLKVFSLRREMEEIHREEMSTQEREKQEKHLEKCKRGFVEMVREISLTMNRACREKRLEIEETGAMYAILRSIVEGLMELYPKTRDVEEELVESMEGHFNELVDDFFHE